MKYVVYGCEHLRDGQEEWAKVCDTIEDAMKIINKDRFAQSNHTFRLFELGAEIPLKQEECKEKEVVIVKSHKVWKLG